MLALLKIPQIVINRSFLHLYQWSDFQTQKLSVHKLRESTKPTRILFSSYFLVFFCIFIPIPLSASSSIFQHLPASSTVFHRLSTPFYGIRYLSLGARTTLPLQNRNMLVYHWTKLLSWYVRDIFNTKLDF